MGKEILTRTNSFHNGHLTHPAFVSLAILTVITALSLFLYMAISKSEDDIQL